MNYWNARQQNAARAQKRTEEFEASFTPAMSHALANTVTYGGKNKKPAYVLDTSPYADFEVVQMSTTEAIYELGHNSCIALNFASYKNPGGGFLGGSCAQEESLCHESWLYNILSRQTDYYDWNKKHLNRGLYQDRALYTPDVEFEHNGKSAVADVLTCAAPNRSIIEKGYNNFTEEENKTAMIERMVFMSQIVTMQAHKDVLILGAWGCGVFKQDPEFVARIIRNTPWYNINKVVLAVIDKPTYAVFKSVFEGQA